MKSKFLFATAIIAATVLSSCNNDDNVAGSSNAAAQLNVKAAIAQNTKSGITGTSFVDGCTLGVFIQKTDLGDNYNDGTDGDLLATTNVPYSVASDLWSADQAIMLSTTVGTVYAYYPYDLNNASNDGRTIPMTIETNQGSGQSDGTKDEEGQQIDYMWATPVSGISSKKYAANLTMNHVLAMVSFQFKQSTDAGTKYPGEGKVSSIVLKGVQAGATTFNISDGEIAAATADQNITVTPNKNETLMDETSDAKLPRMLVYPETIPAAAKFIFTIDGQNYTLDVPIGLNSGADTFVAGNNYVYTITLKGKGLVISSVSIKPWNQVVGGDQELDTPDEANGNA